MNIMDSLTRSKKLSKPPIRSKSLLVNVYKRKLKTPMPNSKIRNIFQTIRHIAPLNFYRQSIQFHSTLSNQTYGYHLRTVDHCPNRHERNLHNIHDLHSSQCTNFLR